MYHVHLGTGIDKSYRSVQEMMGDAMLGVIDTQSRIYHPGTRQWVPVTRHLQLGRALLSGAEPPLDSILDFPPLTAEALAEVEAAAVEVFAGPRKPTVPPPAPPAPQMPSLPLRPDAFYEEPPPPADLEGAITLDDGRQTWNAEYTPLDWRPAPRVWPKLVAGGVAALLVLFLGGWFAWRWWTTPPAARPTAGTPPAATPATSGLTPTLSDSAIAAGLAKAESLAKDTGPRVAAPRARPGAITAATPRAIVSSSPAALQRSYAAAYAGILAGMDSALDIAGTRRLFTLSRLTSPDSLRNGRRSLTAARNIFRAYRGDEVQVERAYRDTVDYLMRESGWSTYQRTVWDSRTTLKDSYEGAQLTDSLLTSVDRIYALLLSEWGQWSRQGAALHFRDAAAAQEYARETAWLDNRLDRLATATSPVATIRRVQGAIGETRPPLLGPQ